ncbi:MAG: diguanylate cyclase domain-containing protein [Gammaproteobacteria bacterium]|nr:MAG: diguanylate cyclase domain-containing protein [Gammaproteobacteria bacterium]
MSSMDTSRYSVLVVDDDEQNRDLLTRSLEKAGYLVGTANDGQQVLDRLGVEHFDLVLLDFMMPRLDGLQVIEAMMRSDRTREIPVIVVTAVGDRAMLAKCVQAGACDYVTKPIEMAILKSRISQVLESRRYMARDSLREHRNQPVTGRILIVEDNEFNRDILTRRVQKWGCDVDGALDGEEAVRLLSAGASVYDLVMLDISMPGKDGFDVLQFIRSREDLSRIPVIMVSAIADAKTVLGALKKGAIDFVTKPFNAVELGVRVQNALRLKKMRDRIGVQKSRLTPDSPLEALIARRKP